MLGATNEEMAEFFEVTESTFYKWLAEKAEFSEAIKRGRAVADSMAKTVLNTMTELGILR